MKMVLAFAGGAVVAVTVFLFVGNWSPSRPSSTAVSAPAPEPAPYVPAEQAVVSVPPSVTAEDSTPSPRQAAPAAETSAARGRSARAAEAKPSAGKPTASSTQPVVVASSGAPTFSTILAEPPASMAKPAPAASPQTTPEAVPERPQLMRPDAVEIKRAKEERKPETVTIPIGTVLTVRTNQPLSSERNQEGESFAAVLDAPLVVNGMVIAEKGSRLTGRVLTAEKGGRVSGRAKLSIQLTDLNTADRQRVAILTDAYTLEADSSTKSDAVKTGAGAAVGAALGAIFGGGKGAAIGAAAGGAAGAGTVLTSRGKPAEIATETRIPFRLKEAVTVTEKLD
ncbi:MAG: hypothetical protein NTV70_25190 [Acidobacteria bacterium]|nr:hypothetical protein [Acidobacteriota bacterium]